MKEIRAQSRLQGVEIRNLRLILNNYYSIKGSIRMHTMVGDAKDIELQVKIVCDLDNA